MKTLLLKLQLRWETNLSIVRLVKSELNSIFKQFLDILTSVTTVKSHKISCYFGYGLGRVLGKEIYPTF